MAAGAVARGYDPHLVGLADAGHEGPAPKRIVTGFGFWIFLLSDIVMFSCFFAAYAVLLGQTAGGPTGAELFNLRSVAVETVCLLLSSFVCGMASIAADVSSHFWFQIAMAVTCVLGLGFLVIEFREFADLVWQPSIPVAIIVLAIAQMGVHLVFFLHITTGPDNTNNVLALAFGLLIVFLVIGGSLWIMDNLNHNMLPMDQIMQMQR